MASWLPLLFLGVFLAIVSSAPVPVKTQARIRTKEFILENQDNDYYYMHASIGNPPQNFSLLLDTSYGYIRVDETECADCTTETKFSKKNSKSFRQERIVNFGKSPAYLGQDTVTFENLKVDNLTLVAMKKASKKDYRGLDGVLGLAFEHPDKGDINLLENLKKRGDIDRAVFAVYLNIDNWKAAEWSSISFGSWNLSRYSWDKGFSYAQANLTKGTWEFDLTNAKLGGVSMDNKPRKAVIASNQNRFVVPKVVYNTTWKHICDHVPCWYDTEPYWNCTRHPRGVLSAWSFTLGGLNIQITPFQYTFKSGKLCYFNFKTMEGNEDWILGTHFMQLYYTLFDAENSRVGFATAKHEESAAYTFWVWFIIIAVILLLIAFCILVGVMKYQESEAKKLNQEIEAQKAKEESEAKKA